jgi:hypothetical protein
MRDIYRAEPIPLIKQVLADMGMIEEVATTSKAEAELHDLQRLQEIMTSHGDYERKEGSCQ